MFGVGGDGGDCDVWMLFLCWFCVLLVFFGRLCFMFVFIDVVSVFGRLCIVYVGVYVNVGSFSIESSNAPSSDSSSESSS